MKKKPFIFLGLFITFLIYTIYPRYYYILKQSDKYLDFKINENKNGICSYIINLDRAKDRWDFVKDNVAKVGYEVKRISAVDGRLLSDEDLKEKVDIKFWTFFTKAGISKGAIGCSLSHIKVWQEFLKSDFEFALIFEDDVSFDPMLLIKAIEELQSNKNLWEMVTFQVGSSKDSFRSYSRIKKLENNLSLVIYSKVVCSGCYLINKEAAKKLLSYYHPIMMPVDDYFTRPFEMKLKLRGVLDSNKEKSIVNQEYGDSYIEKTQRIPIKGFFLLERLEIKIFRIQSSIIRFLYNFKQWFYS